MDTAHKLAILGSLAFDCKIDLNDVYVEGIETVDITDIRNAHEMGYILKLLAIAEKDADQRISLRVHPAFISEHTPLLEWMVHSMQSASLGMRLAIRCIMAAAPA